MANYIAFSRSNYVRAKDKTALTEFLHRFDDIEISEQDGRIGFHTNEDGLPGRWINDDERETIEDCANELGALLADGEVLIIQEIGFEKLRYFVGFSLAIHSSGRTVKVGIEDIYELASMEFDVDEKSITHCSF